MKKTSAEWVELSGLEIIDPDGWNRKSQAGFESDWNMPITLNEFWDKVCRSTIGRTNINSIQTLRRVVFHNL